MMEYVDKEQGGNFEELFKASDGCREMEAEGTMYERMDEDLYTLLMDKPREKRLYECADVTLAKE